jgi:hypothetical protein
MVGTKSAATLTKAKGLLFLLQLHQKSPEARQNLQGVFITLFLNSYQNWTTQHAQWL